MTEDAREPRGVRGNRRGASQWALGLTLRVCVLLDPVPRLGVGRLLDHNVRLRQIRPSTMVSRSSLSSRTLGHRGSVSVAPAGGRGASEG